MMSATLSFLIVAALMGGPHRSAEYTATITRFSDADTLFVERDGKETKVRLWLADAPEIAHNKKQTDQPGARDALEYASTWIGEKVTVKPRGLSYGRQVAEVTKKDATSLGLDLVSRGHAQVDRRYRPPKPYLDAESQAHEKKRGLWKESKPIAPWEWRKKIREKERRKK